MMPLAWLASGWGKIVVGAAIVGGLGLGYHLHRNSLLQAGYDRATAEFQAQQSERLREQLRETARLTQTVKGLQDGYQTSLGLVAQLRDRLRDVDERLRAEQADFERRIAAASADSLRRYASAADSNLARCRADVARFGAEAASCSAAAHALKQNLDALTAQ